ncbi:MAG TPA: PLP-dependent transferase [Acidimicrobiales bacterium]|nr:PLP-dependent transferase [Acidimicrobiales bacterium]
MPDDLDPSTIVVTAGRGSGGPGTPVNVPVELSSTYRAGGDVIYGRESNPSWVAFESAVGALEGGHGVSFASGMAAVAAVASLVPAGGVVVAPEVAYKGARTLFRALVDDGRLGELRLVDITSTADVLAACAGADLLWAESPTNPLLGVADLAAFAGAAPLVAVDNTFASPLLQQPLALGADVAVHSASKLLSGHSDVVLGVAVARSADVAARLRDHRTTHGSIPGPMESFLALRGLRTLAVRIERASATAAELARRLDGHAAVESVRYPGFGTMVAPEVSGGAAAADAVCDALRLAVPATSLGGVETLVERRGKYAGEEAAPPGLLRVSVGLEHVEDLWADLDRALAAATRHRQT